MIIQCELRSVMSNALPKICIANLFEADPFGQKLWSYHLGDQKFSKYKDKYQQFGLNGALATEPAALADIHGPQHFAYNSVGERIDSIKYHPSYLKLRSLSYGAGIVSQKYKGALANEDKQIRHLIGFSTAYYFAQTETGLFCPICMTDALGRVLEMHAKNDELSLEVLKRLKSDSLDEIWEGAMFLTERQGGSDVGANQVYAEKDSQGTWRLYGEKWFCSNADANAVLVLARIKNLNQSASDAATTTPGTKGLGLFLLTRTVPKDNYKNWEIKRLKEKLGVRSMASAEIDLKGAAATMIGGEGEGFKMMTDMVNMSRIYNSVASIAIARRSILEAYLFSQQRRAFGLPLDELPLYRKSLAELQAEFLVLHFLIFESIKQMDLADQGHEKAAKLLRILTPLCKALSGKFSVFATAESMELIGGNAYIEEHILPRLYRDAQVLPIWEGTTQIQSLDLLRVIAKDGLGELIHRLDVALENKLDDNIREVLNKEKDDIVNKINSMAKADPQAQQAMSRIWLERLGRLYGQVLIYEAALHPELKTALSSALQISLGRNYVTEPLGVSSVINAQFEKDILDSIHS